MDDMVSRGLHDFLFDGPTARQPSTLQPINTISTLVGSICCLTVGESVHAGSCPAPGQGDTHGDVRTNRHTPKHTLARCNSSKTLQAEICPPALSIQHLTTEGQAKDSRCTYRQYVPAGMCSSTPEHSLAVNTLHHLFRKDKIREMTTVVISRAGHDRAALKLHQ